MDDASLATLRLSIEVGLIQARRELAQRHDELAESRAALDEATRAREALRVERARWEDRIRDLSGHTLSAAELGDLHRRGEALEARAQDAARRHGLARARVTRAGLRLEEGRRLIGERLARLRWLEEVARRGQLARAQQTARSEDED